MAKSSSRPAQMLIRGGFVVALLLGVGQWLGWLSPNGLWTDLHMVAGLCVLVGIWMAAFSTRTRAGKTVAGTWVAAVFVVIGAGLGLVIRGHATLATAWLHVVLMVIAVALVEMATARARRT